MVLLSSDMQDPPELIAEFIRKWEEGFEVVARSKRQSKGNPLTFLLRRSYYRWLSRFSDEHHIIENYTGFGLYCLRASMTLRPYSPKPV